MTPRPTHLLVTLVLGACRATTTEAAAEPRIEQSVYAAMAAPPAGGKWKFNGGDGTGYADADAACKAFANSYQPALSSTRLESTESAGTKRCSARAAGDTNWPAVTLVFIEGEDAAVALADADGLPAIEAALVDIAKKCEAEKGQPSGNQTCDGLGRDKHACAAAQVELAQSLKDGPRSLYSAPAFDRWGNMFGKLNPDADGPARIPRTEGSYEAQASAYFYSGNSPYASVGQAIGAAKKGKLFPDVVVAEDPSKRLERGNAAAIYDFKFPCPPDKKAAWGFNKSTGRRQDRAYNSALDPGQNAKRIQPG